jgi:hypothetical protein
MQIKNSLKAAGDPMVYNHFVNLEAIELAYLLPNDIL